MVRVYGQGVRVPAMLNSSYRIAWLGMGGDACLFKTPGTEQQSNHDCPPPTYFPVFFIGPHQHPLCPLPPPATNDLNANTSGVVLLDNGVLTQVMTQIFGFQHPSSLVNWELLGTPLDPKQQE